MNVRAEKTSEAAFYQALSEASASWDGVKVLSYCCAESIMFNDSKTGGFSLGKKII